MEKKARRNDSRLYSQKDQQGYQRSLRLSKFVTTTTKKRKRQQPIFTQVLNVCWVVGLKCMTCCDTDCFIFLTMFKYKYTILQPFLIDVAQETTRDLPSKHRRQGCKLFVYERSRQSDLSLRLSLFLACELLTS